MENTPTPLHPVATTQAVELSIDQKSALMLNAAQAADNIAEASDVELSHAEINALTFDHIRAAIEMQASHSAVPVELWRDDKKVTIYPGENVMCMTTVGGKVEFNSDVPFTLDTAQNAVDWLYVSASHSAAASTSTLSIDIARLKFFRDLSQAERTNIFRAFGIEDDMLAEVRTHSDERRLFNHLFANSAAADAVPVAEWVNEEQGFQKLVADLPDGLQLFTHPSTTTAPASDLIAKMRDLIKVQGSQGNWDYDPYMQGMYNGMELYLAMVEDREPVFRDAPAKWGNSTAPAATTPAASIDTPEFAAKVCDFARAVSHGARDTIFAEIIEAINAHTAAQVAANKPADPNCRWPMCESEAVQEQAADGKFSAFFKDRATGQEAWCDQADDTAPAKQEAAPLEAVPEGWRLVSTEKLRAAFMLIDPPPMEIDGVTRVFVNPNAANNLTMLSAAVRDLLATKQSHAAPTNAKESTS